MYQKKAKSTVAVILVGLFLGSLAQGQTVEISPVNKATDLDLSGDIIYAINFGNNGNPTIGGVVFSQDQDCPDVHIVVTAEGEITNWANAYPNTGDANLDVLLGGIVWRNNTASRTTYISAGGLEMGISYQLQLIFLTDHNRRMDIVVEGDVVIEEYDPYPVQTSVTPRGGSVVTCAFTAADETLNIEITPRPNDGSTASTISGLVLTKLWSPSPDFNGDYVIDIEDLIILIEHWGQDEFALDLAPPPSGDSTVDVLDLEVFMSYWGQELDDPTLVAHWKLDETEGMIVSDSPGDHDGTVMGLPTWHPAGGIVDGALELDGETFVVVADSVLNPNAGPFSVFAWINGGAPGQAIISQQAGADWLMLDPATGALGTELWSGGRQSSLLCSDVFIADGNWHRLGFTWDGTNRRLYVDDILVAEDTDVALADCKGGMNIGCGKIMAPGTFFSGLIDDIRIYTRTVKP